METVKISARTICHWLGFCGTGTTFLYLTTEAMVNPQEIHPKKIPLVMAKQHFGGFMVEIHTFQ
jgi:hypothetical protein